MAFDRTNTADLIALRDEQALDPRGVDYAAVDGQTQATLDLFNLESNNPGAEIGLAKLTANKLLKIIFTEAISSQDQFKIQLLFESSTGLADDISNFITETSSLSPALATSIAANTRHLNIAEVLFADDDENGVKESVTISRDDWFAARDYIG